VQEKATSRALSPEHQTFGMAVREARGWRGVTQEELGYLCELHRNYVGSLERGEINPTFRSLLSLARGLALPLSVLMMLYERQLADAG
jgi:transcriptional regulator with XRE-family HTH domain